VILEPDKFRGNIADLAVLMLRLDDEDSEGRFGPAAIRAHDDALGLFDDGPVFHGRMEAFDLVDQSTTACSTASRRALRVRRLTY
jgi:hypothetical protein